ncbi:DUF7344 domain-containing protein [Halomarina oriensis]|uniref:DUF7344 domain-containing protein n=1 Tax=Halomarina oriensis TaxID=671145 RepID=A0A6B0GTA0_9EURY|nr:hypothetical protein [Halomarina oriensis]MWG34938.1 hypothetical protein [Halomarina oriensis]
MDDSSTEATDPSTAHDLLQTAVRRAVVRLLLETDRQWDVEPFADELLRRDDLPADHADDRLPDRLYHRALPRLDDAGVVEFDTDAHTVEPTDRLPDLASFLRSYEQSDRRDDRPEQ